MVGTKVFVVSQDPSLRRRIKNILTKNGYTYVGEAEDGINALRLVRAIGPDLVIVDFELPHKAVAELIQIIEEDRMAPIIIISSTWESELVERHKSSWIFAFLVRPIEERNLLAAAGSTLVNFERMLKLEQEVEKLKGTLETRKVVEKAKGLLIDNLGLSEAEAFRKIQHQSMDRAIPMKQVAEAIILTYDISKTKRG